MARSPTESTRTAPKGAGPNYRVPALEKGLDILEHLSTTPEPQSQADLARALNRSPSELFRMLTCLEERNFIRRDATSGKYQLTLKLFELAHTHAPNARLLDAAREPMRRVATELRESCHVGVLSDTRLMIFAGHESPEPIRISVEVGRTFPALLTASGRLLLAHLPPDALADRLERSAEYRTMSDAQRSDLHAFLAGARSNGYVVTDSDLVVGVRDYSVLIGNPKAGVVAAIAVPVLMTRGRPDPEEAVLAMLREQAAEITGALGLNP